MEWNLLSSGSVTHPTDASIGRLDEAPMSRSDNRSTSTQSGTVPSSNATLPWWLCTIIIIGAFLMATGAVIALVHPEMLVSPHAEINGAVETFAHYFAVRNLTLALMLLAALVLGARGMLNSLVLLSAFIQALDMGMDCVEHRWTIVPGVAVLALLFFLVSVRLSGYPFWRIEAWKQD
jgi:hypothetical protein